MADKTKNATTASRRSKSPAKMLPIALADIQDAATTIKSAIKYTNCDQSLTLSGMFDCQVWLKFENLQFTGAFKERGALNKLSALSEAERARGVIAMSAGNHAQGVAYHAGRLQIAATIVMPEATPTVKVENTRAHGATVILHGATLDETASFVSDYAKANNLVIIHPFDDEQVIAGQGTIALEMLAAVPDLDVLIVPIGGGGLISGMAIAAKALKPNIKIIGVEAALYPTLYNETKNKKLLISGDTLAEGLAVKTPGKITAPLVKQLVDEIILVTEEELERAVALLINIEKTVVEGAGAAGLAALAANPAVYRNQNVGLVLCGGNIDTRLLSSVLSRELAREGRLTRLTLDIPDRPGQLAKVTAVIAQTAANILEVYHQRVFTDLPAKGTELHLVIETRDGEQLDEVVASLREAEFIVHVKSSMRR